MPSGYRKTGGWPITLRVQNWIAVAFAPFAFAGMEVMSRHNPAALYGGALIAFLAIVPHEHLHTLAAMRLGLRVKVYLWPVWIPHTQSEGVLGMRQVLLTSLAPQALTAALASAAGLLHAPMLAVAAILHGLISVGDYAHAAYAFACLLRPSTRQRLLLNGTGSEAGVYQQWNCRSREPSSRVRFAGFAALDARSRGRPGHRHFKGGDRDVPGRRT